MNNDQLTINNYPFYKDSGVEWLGDVPEHWEVSRVKSLGILSRGVDISRDNFIEGSFPVYGSNGVIGYHSQFTTKAPCLTVGRSGSVGEVNYISEDFWAHNTTLYLQKNFKNNIKFIFYLFKSLNLQSWVYQTCEVKKL
jgi:type I restriction enzyme S subunit